MEIRLRKRLGAALIVLAASLSCNAAGPIATGITQAEVFRFNYLVLQPNSAQRYELRMDLGNGCLNYTFDDASRLASALQAKQFSPNHLPEIALSPREAARRLVRNDVDYLPIDAIHGRIVKDDERSIAAQLQADFLDLVGTLPHQEAADFGGTSEGIKADVLVFDQPGADIVAVALHQLKM